MFLGAKLPRTSPTHTPQIIGHRGAAGLAPENTLSAFATALKFGVDAIELDVQLSADGQVMVFHDFTLERLTDGHGRLADFTCAELQRLDAGRHFGAAYRGERIPTLLEVVDSIGSADVALHIELKVDHTTPAREHLPLVHAVSDLIRVHDLAERCLIISFQHALLHEMHAIAPELAYGEIWGDAIPTSATFGAVALRWNLMDATVLGAIHARGQAVTVWTVNDADAAQAMIALGVDAIGSDYPDMVLGLLG